MTLILESVFSLNNIFEKNLGVWQILENTFKILKKSFVILKNHLWRYLDKHLIGGSLENTSIKNILNKIIIKQTINYVCQIIIIEKKYP